MTYPIAKSNRSLAAFYLLAGLGTIAASYAVAPVLRGQRAWTDLDAHAYQAAAANLHDAIHARGHSHDPASDGLTEAERKRKLDVARREFDRQQARLNAVRNRGKFFAISLRVFGVIAALAGIGVTVVGTKREAG